MKIKGIEVEDFVNYKKCSMFIALGTCDWKCCIEANIPVDICQNSKLAKTIDQELSIETIYKLYNENPLSEAIVIGGLEPLTQTQDILDLIKYFREQGCKDDFIIYTGFYPHEISKELILFSEYDNIIIKFGRYIPDDEGYIDPILGIKLASKNQYAVKLNKDSKRIIEAMCNNDGYCPCRIDKNEDTKCCCLDFRNQIEGTCCCGIFSK